MEEKVTLIFVLIVFTLIFSFFMTFIGMSVGGTFFANFELFGATGYEAVGNLGTLSGLIFGIILSVYFYLKKFKKKK